MKLDQKLGQLLKNSMADVRAELCALNKLKDRIADLPVYEGPHKNVIVIPGYQTGDCTTKKLRQILASKNFQVYACNIKETAPYKTLAMDSLEYVRKEIKSRLASLQGSVSIIGVSAGGILARELAYHYPDKVDRLITLGTLVRYDVQAFKNIKEADINQKFERVDTLELTKSFNEAQAQKPRNLEITSIYSQGDQFISPKASQYPEIHGFENVCLTRSNQEILKKVSDRNCHGPSHFSLGFNLQAIEAIFERLSVNYTGSGQNNQLGWVLAN